MLVGLMITDNGPHPPEKWAAVTASQIIDIASTAPEMLYKEARDFEAAVTRILVGHHQMAQSMERDALAAEGSQRLAGPIDTDDHVADALDDIVALANASDSSGKPRFSAVFRNHFNNRETLGYLEALLHGHMHENMRIERSWHADANPDHPYSIAFKAVASGGHGLLALPDEALDEHGGRQLVSAMVKSAIPGSHKGEEC